MLARKRSAFRVVLASAQRFVLFWHQRSLIFQPMSQRIVALSIFALTLLLRPAVAADPVVVSPKVVQLVGPEASEQLLILDRSGKVTRDITRSAKIQLGRAGVIYIDSNGRVSPIKEGKTEIHIRQGNSSLRVPVEVTGLARPIPVSFRHQIIPILSKAGCNSGGCHGKAEGQNGFKLSVFGFDPSADHRALANQSRGRRLSLGSPAQSLLLLKATGDMPHGGGRKVVKGSLWYRQIARWIGEGAQLANEQVFDTTSIEVEPREVIISPGSKLQLRVTARDKKGNLRSVTAEAEYKSNSEPICEVDHNGLISAADIPGEVGILVRFMGHVAVCRVTLPRQGIEFKRPPEHNFVDRLVWNKLQRLGIKPSPLASDAVFLRRVHLDVIGALPTVAEAKRFLADKRPDKRKRLIDQLLSRNEYADYWAMRWADILQIDKNIVTPQGAVAMTRWLRKQFKQNRPYDEFVRSVVMARGNILVESPAAFYRVHNSPEKAGRSISQVFLGIRIECAQCHHHPFEKWSQRDYYAFAGFFTGVNRLSAPGGGTKILSAGGSNLKHPRTGKVVEPAGLGAPTAKFEPNADRRTRLASWMTSAKNPFVARTIANRLWAHYLGRGLVEPVDDMRATNPATNEPLLDALAQHLINTKFDLHQLTRAILNSRVYQLSSGTNPTNARDEQNYSHSLFKALPAEVLLDAICHATQVPEKFNGWPVGYRAIQVWDNHMPSYFFRVFGKPARVTVCECERGNEPSMAQALHLLNAPETAAKLHSRFGRVARLSATNKRPVEIINALYLAALSRFPLPAESKLMLTAFEGASRRQAAEDVMWTLLNTKEFLYNH